MKLIIKVRLRKVNGMGETRPSPADKQCIITWSNSQWVRAIRYF
jgi:hypothetical protein